MNDNVIAYILSLVCIIFILIEIVSVNKKKGMADLIVFFYYSCPLYYFMLYRGDGGAAFTWWFYLLLLTFIHSFGNLGVPICQNHCCQTYKTEK